MYIAFFYGYYLYMSAGESKIGIKEQINDLLYEEDLQGDLEEKLRVVVNLKKFQENGGDIATLIKYIPKNMEVIIGETKKIFFIGHLIYHYEDRNIAEFRVYNREGQLEDFSININAIEEIFKLAKMENEGKTGGKRQKRKTKKRKRKKRRRRRKTRKRKKKTRKRKR